MSQGKKRGKKRARICHKEKRGKRESILLRKKRIVEHHNAVNIIINKIAVESTSNNWNIHTLHVKVILPFSSQYREKHPALGNYWWLPLLLNDLLHFSWTNLHWKLWKHLIFSNHIVYYTFAQTRTQPKGQF